MKKIAYCLQNSGDPKVENLANRIFGDNLLKNANINNPTSFNNTIDDSNTVFNHRDSLLNKNMKTKRQSFNGNLASFNNTNMKSRRQSINNAGDVGENKANNAKRQSLFNYEDKANKSRKQSVLEEGGIKSIKIIPEENNENENDN